MPRRSRHLPVLIAIGLFILIVLLVPWPTRQERSWMDAVTGSMKRESFSSFGQSSGMIIQPSALEIRLRESGIEWQADWRFLHNRHVQGGSVRMWECGSAPEIYSYTAILDRFVELSSDDDLRAFVQIMQSGTEAEQRAALDAAADKTFAIARQP